MLGTILILMNTIPLLISTYVFKSRYKLIDLLLISILVLIVNANPLLSSVTLKNILLFFLLLVSFYYSEREPLLAGIYSSLIFINDIIAITLTNSVHKTNPESLILSFTVSIVISLTISLLLAFSEKKILLFIQDKFPQLKVVLLIFCLFIFFKILKSKYLIELTIPNNESVIVRLLGDILLALFLFLAAIVIIAQRSETMRLESESKKAIYENQLAYLKSIEKNAEEVRKFKHDYQNILLSMDSYFHEDKYEDLKKYYFTQIKQSSESLNIVNTQLNKLSRIQSMALRSIFYVKLSIIDSEKVNLNLEIDKNFFVEEKDEISLVRALGIILDNSVDALEELEQGDLQIALIENDGSNLIIVKNSCSADLPPLYQLEEKGFSTKGSNRGIGLSNLREIMEETDLLLETEIVDQYFIQKIIF